MGWLLDIMDQRSSVCGYELNEENELKPSPRVPCTPLPPGTPKIPNIAPPDESDIEERRAIIEHFGGIPRAWAEGLAYICAMPAPSDVPAKRWRTFVDDCARFAETWASKAISLGWGPYDLFGCDDLRPYARIDRQGLCWLLNGRSLIALTEASATIESPSVPNTGKGSMPTQTFIRRPGPTAPGVVLAWQLSGEGTGV